MWCYPLCVLRHKLMIKLWYFSLYGWRWEWMHNILSGQRHNEIPAQWCYSCYKTTSAALSVSRWGLIFLFIYFGRCPFPTEVVDFINLPFQSIFIITASKAAGVHKHRIHIKHKPLTRPYHSVPADDEPSPVTVLFKTSRRETLRWPWLKA